ncbi:hypothetical protein [uncultured Endozoicomonas sp.]|uniref:hypothetical protein n=1 Tax=uncultured Endozoicomonas sp. TaxID=432652 RepID=UPI002619B118|nr:hypothetical protein [uncultured Endozoicomonas sp.]
MSDFSKENSISESGNDPNFMIVSNHDKGFSAFNRKVDVFGIPIYAVYNVKDDRLLHAANVMAQYLDNDEDGKVDNPSVLDAMKDNHAFMIMWESPDDLNDMDEPEDAIGQDLGNDETMPKWHTNGHRGRFDASLEEVWHIISHAGYASAYPEVFGETPGTLLTNAMDQARGGQFLTIPPHYPENAWYTYDDDTCDYSCMATEYFYWAITSLLGAQENRKGEVSDEWQLYTPALLKEKDSAVYRLLTTPEYNLPQTLPNGVYRPVSK